MNRSPSVSTLLVLGALLAGASLVATPAHSQDQEKALVKWEYKIVSPQRKEEGAVLAGGTRAIDAEKLAKALNELGEQGWECVGTINDVRGGSSARANITDVFLLFKRLKR